MTDKGFVKNPILLFLNDKVDVMKHADLVSLCSSCYDKVEIKDAKKIIFSLLESNGVFVSNFRLGDATLTFAKEVLYLDYYICDNLRDDVDIAWRLR